jgi:hypothetical protein
VSGYIAGGRTVEGSIRRRWRREVCATRLPDNSEGCDVCRPISAAVCSVPREPARNAQKRLGVGCYGPNDRKRVRSGVFAARLGIRHPHVLKRYGQLTSLNLAANRFVIDHAFDLYSCHATARAHKQHPTGVYIGRQSGPVPA